MKKFVHHFRFLFLNVLVISFSVSGNPLFAATSQKAMVVTADERATNAAVDVLVQGGNAVDAAIAAQWVLNVVEPQSSGIGGGGFFLFYSSKDKKIYAFDGREAAPDKAFPEMFFDKKTGKPYPYDPDRITGGLGVGVPGVLKLLHEMHSRFGSKQFSFYELFDPAIEMAENGFMVSRRLALALDSQKERLKLFPESRRIFLDTEGFARPRGYRLKQPELAHTFLEIKKNGIQTFYEGAIAKSIVEAVQKAPFHPGLLEFRDLEFYEIIERKALYGNYRGYDIFSMGPPSSGGIALLETLNLLEPFFLSKLGRTKEGIHLFSEAQKQAFRDRNEFVGDPVSMKKSVDDLLSKEYAKKVFQHFSFETVLPNSVEPKAPQPDGANTSHISIIDEEGNMVSFTTTIEAICGSAMVVPGRGFFLNNELTDFDEIPKKKDGQLTVNSPGSGKRPRSSMTPTLVFHKGKPFMVLGSPGGSKIISAVLNVIINVIDFKMPLEKALAAPRIMNRDGSLELEMGFLGQKKLVEQLKQKGHQVTFIPDYSNVQAILVDKKTGRLKGESDPRGEGVPRGY